jgi:hypothetical protein
MTRAVLDTNVIVSGLTGEGTQSATAQTLDAWYRGRFVLVSSAYLMAEIRKAIGKPYFRLRVPEPRRIEFIALVGSDAEFTELHERVSGVAAHPEDDLILATALNGRADYLVTGDIKFRALNTFRNISIVTPREFLDLLPD